MTRSKRRIPVLDFLKLVHWLDGTPILPRIEPYRRRILTDVLDTPDETGGLRYNLALLGRAKKNAKSLDLVLAALFACFANDSALGNECYVIASDEGQARDDLQLAKKLVAVSRDRVLWQRFTGAEQIYRRLESAVGVAREALEVERAALKQAEAERKLLAAQRLPATVEEEATDRRRDAVRGYQLTGFECQKQQAAIAELERLLPPPEQILSPLMEATARLLEAVVTVARDAFVRRLPESGELEHLRARFERMRTLANTHDAEIAEWSRRAGRQLRVPRVAFPWPPAPVWDALLSAPTEAPKLIWDDDPKGSSA